MAVGAATLIILLIGWWANPAFLTWNNLQQIVRSCALIGIAALGTMFITIAGHYFSLSIQQTAMVCAICFTGTLYSGWNLIPAILVTLLLAVILGAIQGYLVGIGANPIILTLGAGVVLYGTAAIVTNNEVLRTGTDVAKWIGTARPLGIPTQTYAFLLFTIVAHLVLTRTRLGRLIVLVGANKEAAKASGLSLRTATLAAFIIASSAAGICGIFVAAQFGMGKVDLFHGLNIDVIAAVLVAGTAIQGGKGSALRTMVGTIFIAVLDNILLLTRQPDGIRMFIMGACVVLAVSIFHVLRSGKS